MNYRNYNDYELVYNVHENDGDSWDILYKKYQPIIHKLAGEFYKLYSDYGYDYDDFVQEGNIAFHSALKKYNEKKNSLFYTFVVLCVRRKLISFCHKISADGKKPSNKDMIDIDKCIISDDRENIFEIFRYHDIEKIFKKVLYDLSFEKSMIFELKFNGFSYVEIGILLDIPSSTAEFKNRTAKKKLLQSLHNYYSI